MCPHVTCLLIRVHRVKMSCMGALVNIGHKNFKAQQVIHESNAISILVDLLGPPEGYLGRETRDSALSTAPSGVDGSGEPGVARASRRALLEAARRREAILDTYF